MAQPSVVSSRLVPSHLMTKMLNKAPITIGDLPSELFFKIVIYLPIKQIPDLVLVCKEWEHKITTSDYFIKHFEKIFSKEISEKKEAALKNLEESQKTLKKADIGGGEKIFIRPGLLSAIEESKGKLENLEVTPLLKDQKTDLKILFKNYQTVDIESGKVTLVSRKACLFTWICSPYSACICLIIACSVPFIVVLAVGWRPR